MFAKYTHTHTHTLSSRQHNFYKEVSYFLLLQSCCLGCIITGRVLNQSVLISPLRCGSVKTALWRGFMKISSPGDAVLFISGDAKVTRSFSRRQDKLRGGVEHLLTTLVCRLIRVNGRLVKHTKITNKMRFH